MGEDRDRRLTEAEKEKLAFFMELQAKNASKNDPYAKALGRIMSTFIVAVVIVGSLYGLAFLLKQLMKLLGII